MSSVNTTPHRPSHCARQHVSAMLSVLGSTGLLMRQQMHGVGWVAVGPVKKATLLASLIMTSIEIVQV